MPLGSRTATIRAIALTRVLALWNSWRVPATAPAVAALSLERRNAPAVGMLELFFMNCTVGLPPDRPQFRQLPFVPG